MTQLELDFSAPKPAPATDQQQKAPARKILPFPLVHHTRSAIRLGRELRPLSQAEREKIWGQRTGQLIRSRIAIGFSAEEAIRDVSQWAIFARAALFNPPPERQTPEKQPYKNNIIFPDFSKPCRLPNDSEPQQLAAEGRL